MHSKPILKNQLFLEPKPEIISVDLSHLICKRDVLMQMHGFDWQHPRILAYLARCGVPNRHFLTEAHMKNLVEKLEKLPIPNYEQKRAS